MKPYQKAVERLTGYSWIGCEPWTEHREAKEAAEPGGHSHPSGPKPVQFRSFAPGAGRELDQRFFAATPSAVEKAGTCQFMREVERTQRSKLLGTIADNCERDRDIILAMASRETGLSRKRLTREFDRMVGTLVMFAKLVEQGSWVRASVDTQSTNSIGPGHDVRSMLLPLGPVAVFGASNFPLAYGVLGGDTASALAAGCPVVVKGHPLHPGTGELLARCAVEAVLSCLGTMHDHLFTFLQCGGARAQEIGTELVRLPAIRAVGFTGSFRGGRALEAAIRARTRPWTHEDIEDPIPLFAEMGSCNFVSVGERFMSQYGSTLALELARSILDSSGQQCTKPGHVSVPCGVGYDVFILGLRARFRMWRPRPLLGRSIADQYRAHIAEWRRQADTDPRISVWQPEGVSSNPCVVQPAIIEIRAESPWALPALPEIFGPAVFVTPSQSSWGGLDSFARRARSDERLVASVLLGTGDIPYWATAEPSHDALMRGSGRLCFNTVPTGVRVCTSMVHGGPFPATNVPQTTAVGPRAIERWCRPVCFQNCPDALLPPELQDGNPLGLWRTVNGELTRAGVDR